MVLYAGEVFLYFTEYCRRGFVFDVPYGSRKSRAMYVFSINDQRSKILAILFPGFFPSSNWSNAYSKKRELGL